MNHSYETPRPAWASLGALPLFAALLLALALQLAPSAAAAEVSGVTYQAGDTAATVIHPQAVGSDTYLFLPSSADLSALALDLDGDTAQLTANGVTQTITSGVAFNLTACWLAQPQDGIYPITLTQGGTTLTLNVAASQNIRSLYLTSADASQDRLWVEQSKENKAKKGGVTLLDADGATVYSGTLKNLKGRGNSTWAYPKKPYQLKLSENVDLLQTGDPDEASSTWVLLANYGDATLIHNQLTYDLAADLGLAYSPHCQPVDLYYDGEYRGSYLLSEKTEIAAGRVGVHNLEADIEDANPDVDDFDALDTQLAANSYGNQFQYVTGLTMPEDISGGYLLELDYAARAVEEKSWFTTTSGKYVVCKSPEYLSADAVAYISEFYQEFEDAVWNGGVNPTTGKDYTEYVDLTSLAKCYLLLELTQDNDAFLSSTYFYKPQGEDKLYAGPVWDFDTSYGSSADTSLSVTDLVAGQTTLGRRLLAIDSFREEVARVYQEELYPLVTNVALGDDQAAGTLLRSISGYGDTLSASQALDHILWPATTPAGYDSALSDFQSFLQTRNEYLYTLFTNWDEQDPFRTGYVDVPEDAWYLDAVADVTQRGLFTGTTDLTFSPQGTMTRGMVVTVLYRLAGQPGTQGTAAFSDVAQSAWYTQAVAWASEAGIAAGYPDGTFLPNQPITRQELVTFLHRYAQWSGEAGTASGDALAAFSDANQVADWAKTPFAWAIQTGLVNGTTSTTLSPQGQALRCQGAAIFQRYCQ
jgi:hypothetical protein